MVRNILVGLMAVLRVLTEKCGVHIPEGTTFSKELLSGHGFAQPGTVPRADFPPPPKLDLFVHVVAGSEDRRDGYLTEAEVNGQVEVIKTHYTPTGITFNHNKAMTKWYVNSSWAGDSTNFDEMKATLHVGDYKTINLYIRNITDEEYGGTCSHPWLTKKDIPDKTRRLALDGCVVATFSLPNSYHPFMNQGKTAVHEMGHWFGLWHPFENGGIWDGPNRPDACRLSNPDDNVTDTPKMLMAGVGLCVETQNSCREPAGQPPIYDPVHNYMTYSSDACLDRFSDGQVARMYAIYDEFRKTGQPI